MPFEKEILGAVGFTEKEARDFIKKHQAYLDSLTPKEHEAVAKSLPTWQEAATAIHPEMTAKDLQDFVAARGGPSVPATALCFLAVRKP